MQTYEITPDESIESLMRSLSRLARRDKDIVLIVPADVNPFTQPESVQKLNGVMRSYDARVRVQAADPALVRLFQSAGFLAGPLQPGVASSTPAAPATPPAAPAPAGGDMDLPDDIANMNFDYQDVGGPPASAGAGAGAPQGRGGGGFFQRLRNAVAPPAAPARADAYGPPPAGDTPPDWLGVPGPAADEFPGESGPSGLDVTLPDWLRDAQPEVAGAGDRVAARVPVSNLDVMMPSWLSDTPTPATPTTPGTGDLDLPGWLSEGGGEAPGATTDADLPDWLRGDTPVAPAAAAPPVAPPAPTVLPAPPMAAAPPPIMPSGAPPASAGPPQAAPQAAPAPAPAPSAAAPGFDLSSIGGPAQTPESIGQAVRAAGLDMRTRSLLLFGMALVRLAPGEAAGAATAARLAGCTDDDLRLVVQMAQALGGGPSERLGRKILG